MTHLSEHFEEARLARGLKPGELARLAGCTNISKSGHRIRQFELNGDLHQELFEKIATVLGIDDEVIQRLVEQDRQEFFAEWEEWVSHPIKPFLVIRLVAAFYSKRDVPPGLALEEAEKWASDVALEFKKRCCLVWSRRLSCWFLEDGTLERRTEAEPGVPNMPWMMVGGKKFLLRE